MKGSRFTRIGAALISAAAMTLGYGGLSTAQAVETKATATADQIADANAQVKALNLRCDIGKVSFLGEGDLKGKDGKPVKVQGYEVTCGNRFGYVVQGPKGGSDLTIPQACPGLKQLATTKKDSHLTQCKFPENQDPNPALQTLISKTGMACAVKGSKWLGVTADHTDVFEVACQGGPGYRLEVPLTTDEVRTTNCMALDSDAAHACTLTTAADKAAWLGGMVAKSGKTCEVTKTRFVGRSTSDGAAYYEVGCAKGVGFMIQTGAKDDQFKRTVDCADAAGLGGGCTLTEASAVQASAAASFGDRLKAAGIPCNVVKARLVGQTGKKRDVVEYACSDRPAGLIVALPSEAGQAPDAVDCLSSRHFGIQCEFMTREAQMALLTKALAAGGKTCAVSNFQAVATDDKAKTRFFEVMCGSEPGYIAEIKEDYSKAVGADTCTAAAKTSAKTGLSCALPGNH